MNICINTNSNGRTLTIDNKPFQFINGNGIVAEASAIETYSPCDLLDFNPICVEFEEEYTRKNNLFNINDDCKILFEWDDHHQVRAHVSIFTPQVYLANGLEYQLNLCEVIKSQNFVHNVIDTFTGSPNSIDVFNNVVICIKGSSYKAIYSKLNKILGQLHKSTIQRLGWK